jgi:hypothetical protein
VSGFGFDYDADTPRPPEPPSFEPWLARVRMARSFFAVTGFVLVTALTYMSGMPVDDAALRGIVVAVIGYFVAWGGSLWLFSELYFVQVNRIRTKLQEYEQMRADQLQQMYLRRLNVNGDAQNSNDTIDTTALRPPPSEQAAA